MLRRAHSLLPLLVVGAALAQGGRLAPTDAKDKTPSDFARFVAVGDGGHFDTAITTYRNDAGVEVRLFAAVHIADGALYAALQERFAACDALLYELVGPEDYRPKRGEGGTGSFVSLLQNALKSGLELEFQLDGIDYSAPNFVHADMTPQEFEHSMSERGETLLGLIWKMSLKSTQVAVDQDGGAKGGPSFDLVKAFRSGEGRHRLRVMLAAQLEQLEAVAAGAGAGDGDKGSTLLEGRNEKCLEVLQREIAAGKRKLGIYYGAAHLTHMERRLCDDLGFHKVDHEWLLAWDCTPRPDPKVDRELWAARRKAKAQIAAIAGAVDAWLRATHGEGAPTFAQLQQPGADGQPYYGGPTRDPWGHDYVIQWYERTPNVDVQSLGQDGVPEPSVGRGDDLHSASMRDLARMRRGSSVPQDKPGPGPVPGLLDDLHREARQAKLTKAAMDAKTIRVAAESFRAQNGRWPKPKDLATPAANGQKFFDGDLTDPWGNDFALRPSADGKTIEVRSAGPDGAFDTDDDVVADGGSRGSAERSARLHALHGGALYDPADGQDFTETAGYRRLLGVVAAAGKPANARAATPLDLEQAMHDPDALRGERVLARGILLRIRAEDLEVAAGPISKVWRAIVFYDDAKSAMVVDLLEQPPATPQGNVEVEVEGLFWRIVSYESQDGRKRDVPYLLARRLQIVGK